MQVNDIESLFSVFWGKKEEQPRQPEDGNNSRKFSAKKTALDMRFRDFSISISSSKLSGSTPDSEVYQYGASQGVPPKTEQKTVSSNEEKPVSQPATDSLVERVKLLSHQIVQLQDKIGSLEEHLSARKPSGVNTLLVPDPAILAETELKTDGEAVQNPPFSSPPSPINLALYNKYSTGMSETKPTQFHAMA